jgi:hypothetical protein
MTPEQILSHSFGVLELPPDAAAWLLDVWKAVQVFDDVADGDAVSGDDLNHAIWASLVGLQINPFHARHGQSLVPVLALQILKWHAANHVERAGEADARSFMWRAGYYDLVLMVVCLCHGPEKAAAVSPVVMRMYGETLDEYFGEFRNA